MIRLGVNIDHVATLRQARGETFPDPLVAAQDAIDGGADGITAHLREDRRHIQDSDIANLKRALRVPLNMELAAVPSMASIAEKTAPAWVCLVPERRQELTTEGGLNVTGGTDMKETIQRLKRVGIKVSFFIDPDLEAVRESARLGADAVELHTGPYARAWSAGATERERETARVVAAAEQAASLGLVVNAGHGLDYDNVGDLAQRHPFHEFNIGFAIVARALRVGMRQAVATMKERMN